MITGIQFTVNRILLPRNIEFNLAYQYCYYVIIFLREFSIRKSFGWSVKMANCGKMICQYLMLIPQTLLALIHVGVGVSNNTLFQVFCYLLIIKFLPAVHWWWRHFLDNVDASAWYEISKVPQTYLQHRRRLRQKDVPCWRFLWDCLQCPFLCWDLHSGHWFQWHIRIVQEILHQLHSGMIN